MAKKNSARRTFLIMVAVFAVPYALAWFLFLNPQMLNLGSRANGTLVDPMVVPGAVPFTHTDGRAFPAADEGEASKWMLLMFGRAPCEQACEKSLFTLQQLRKMMAVEKARLRRAYVSLEGKVDSTVEGQLAAYQGTELFLADSAALAELEQQLGIETGMLDQHIVIADPMGNLVMLYPRDVEPKKVFADLEILFGRVKGV